MPNRAFLIIKAIVPPPDRAAFDRWYEAEHMPEAVVKLKAEAAWRLWSLTDSDVHYAVYEFGDETIPLEIKARAEKEGGANLVWPSVKFSREVVRLYDQYAGATRVS